MHIRPRVFETNDKSQTSCNSDERLPHRHWCLLHLLSPRLILTIQNWTSILPFLLRRQLQNPLAHAARQIHLMRPHPQLPPAMINARIFRRGAIHLPEDVQADNKRSSEVRLEELLRVRRASDRLDTTRSASPHQERGEETLTYSAV